MADIAVRHDELRPLMFSIAYRMLGSVAEAEDVVQDAFLRMHAKPPGDEVRSPDAYATTVTTRLAIDALRSARRRRERYVGTWLPEPLVEGPDADPALRVELDDTVSVAFLTVLERLSPLERAVFLLREVFGYEYDETATVVERSATYCRQLLRRARRHLDDDRARFTPTDEDRQRLAESFFAAVRDGDVAELEKALAEDVVLYGDGGGKAPAVRRPVEGATQVARFLLGLARLAAEHQIQLVPASVNGAPGALSKSSDGDIVGVVALTVRGGRVVAVHNQINPDKLRHLGPVGDLQALLTTPR